MAATSVEELRVNANACARAGSGRYPDVRKVFRGCCLKRLGEVWPAALGSYGLKSTDHADFNTLLVSSDGICTVAGCLPRAIAIHEIGNARSLAVLTLQVVVPLGRFPKIIAAFMAGRAVRSTPLPA